jgi:hypothetical protein
MSLKTEVQAKTGQHLCIAIELMLRCNMKEITTEKTACLRAAKSFVKAVANGKFMFVFCGVAQSCNIGGSIYRSSGEPVVPRFWHEDRERRMYYGGLQWFHRFKTRPESADQTGLRRSCSVILLWSYMAS